MGAYKEPHGGVLKELYLEESAAEKEKEAARDYRNWALGDRQLCDLELILNGAFSPLEGFLGEADYLSVLADMRLTSGLLWPIPVTLDVDAGFAGKTAPGEMIVLEDKEGVAVATMEVTDIWHPDKAREANAVYGTGDEAHPGVATLRHKFNEVYLGGRLRGIDPPTHYDFKLLRDSPLELRGRFRKLGWRKVVAFQSRNPMHRAEQELTMRAARDCEANLLLQPAVGEARAGDVKHFTRVRCYEHVLQTYPEQTTTLSILNLATRMAGPREALWHGIIRKNFGCTHFIVNQDHAGAGRAADGTPFYEADAAQDLFAAHEDELAIAMVPAKAMVYVEDRAQYLPVDETTAEMHTSNLSENEFRRRLGEGLEIPDWYSFPEVIRELRRVYPPRHQQGFTVFFTGLSGSGKSTVANALLIKLMEHGARNVTLLDGDVVRKNLSSELGFSHEHRDLNIVRIGFVAGEISKHGGIAICAPIAPYRLARRQARELVEAAGSFIEVYLSTPLAVCEARDRKGLYAKARDGIIPGFTGIDDPYEEPEAPEVEIDTTEISAELAAHRILIKLEGMGLIL